jgi:glycerol-3-phosphate dehydrogenase
MTDAHVAVVGGGATGLGVARDLALRGVDVTVCERDRLGAGATVNSHGLLHSGARYAGEDPAVAAECIRENRVLRRIAGACVEPTGGLLVALEGDHPDWLDDRVAACREAGLPATLLGRSGVREAAPAVTADVVGGARIPDAVLHRRRLVAATAAAVREAGGTIHTGAPVTDIRVRDGLVAGLELDGSEEVPDRVEADHVVNAAGAWAAHVADLAEVPLPMAPTVGTMVTVDASPGVVLNRCRPPSSGDIVVPTPSGGILGTTSTPAPDPDAPPDESGAVEHLREACGELFPPARTASVSQVYQGLRPLPDTERGGRDTRRASWVVDHEVPEHGGQPGLTSVVGGKLTTHRAMAAEVADRICDRLDVSGRARTATRPLPHANDLDALDRLVDELAVATPADGPTPAR